MARVLIIIGSGRKVRNTPILAKAIYSIAKASSPKIDYELVDLKELDLPYDSEVDMAASGKYSSKNTLAWSKLVDESQGFIVISPQYNWGYPAILKNALDHLYK